MNERTANRTQGETMGPEQEPTEAGDQDVAVRDPRADGPLQPDPEEASDEFGKSPDVAYRQREGQAEPEESDQPDTGYTPREGPSEG
jgi:hypothetical protein